MHLLTQGEILLASHQLNGTEHRLVGHQVVDLLTLSLVLQFLSSIHDVVQFLLTTFSHDVLHPLQLHEQGIHLLLVAIADDEKIVGEIKCRLVARTHRSTIG